MRQFDNTATLTTSEPVQRSVPYKLGELEKVVAELDQCMGNLSSRLEPVMASSNPKVSSANQLKAIDGCNCPTAGRINTVVERVKHILEEISDITSRLEV